MRRLWLFGPIPIFIEKQAIPLQLIERARGILLGRIRQAADFDDHGLSYASAQQVRPVASLPPIISGLERSHPPAVLRLPASCHPPAWEYP
jgi:hypothetical protein